MIDHWSSLGALAIGASDSIIDIGTGSGVQALSLIARSSGKTNVKCVDINKRALRITRLNFEWNNFDEPTLLLGDINQPSGRIFESDDDDPKPWKELFGNSVTYIVSNPPFLPVPINNPTISSRYGVFSCGGLTGEEFLESLVRLASDVLDRTNPSATLAVVSEFMNPQGDFDRHLSSWWSDSGGPAEALLLTNEQAISATTYAQRRADSTEEAIEWEEHLKQMGINHISPGLLFLKRNRNGGQNATPLVAEENTREDSTFVDIKNCLVPKSTEGSIWTPTNQFARNFTRSSLVEFLRL
ncbi:MAG: polypeptide subunit release factor methylase [Bacillariaceae sp.]